MTTECSLNYVYSTIWYTQHRHLTTQIFGFLYPTCNSMNNLIVIFWVNWCKNECFWQRITCTEIEKSKSDLSMCPKLGRHLLIKKGSQDRQRAKPAIQLLSSTTADVALRWGIFGFGFLLFPQNERKIYKLRQFSLPQFVYFLSTEPSMFTFTKESVL